MTDVDHNSFELSTSQLGIWMGQKINPNDPLYNMVFRFDFESAINPDHFISAFRILVQASDAMRCVFVEDDTGAPKVTIKKSINCELTYLDYSVGDNPESRLEEWINDQKKKIFNLSESLFDTALIKLNDFHYVWYLNQHHLITDGWSYCVQVEHMLEIYRNLEDGLTKQVTFPQYSEFLETIPEQRLQNRVRNASSYWNDRLEARDDADLGRKNLNYLSNSIRTNVVLNASISEKVKLLAATKDFRTWSLDLSIYNIFLTVLFATVSELFEEKKLIIGSPILNRNSIAHKKTIGLFIEMFPIIADLGEDENYISLFKKVNQGSNSFLKYGIGEASNSLTSKSFRVVLNYINAQFIKSENLPFQATWIHSGNSDPNHFIQLQITDFNKTGRFELAFDLNESVFSSEEQDTLVDRFQEHLDAMLINQDSLLLSSSSKKEDSIEDVNDNYVSYPDGVSILDLFEQQVDLRGTETALVFEGEEMSFQELNSKSNQLAHFLVSKGIGPEVCVSICLERSFEMIVTILGILKSGGAYVPIDTEYPIDRIKFIYEDSESQFLITQSKCNELFSFLNKENKLLIDVEYERINDQPVERPQLRDLSKNLMYTIYTSGTTGVPKGVMNQHDGVMNRMWWAYNEFKLTSEDVIVLKTSYTFDVSVNELLLPLMLGCKMVICKPKGHRDCNYLKQLVQREGITLIHFVPTMLDVFLEHVQIGDCPSIKLQLCTGEPLKPSAVNKFNLLFPHAAIYNLYGPTEAAIEVSFWAAPQDVIVETVPIGKPMPNVQLYILDSDGNTCAVGEQGELYIGGVQVARGYKNRTKLNSQKFVADFMKRDSGYKLFKTGDLCQWNEEGDIEFFGRMDSQVKFRGNRIELEEIEAVAKGVQGLSQCIVLIHEAKVEKQMVLFYESKARLDVELIRLHLLTKLPSYMLPTKISWIEKFPRLTNGKIDRNSLLGILNSSAEEVYGNEDLNEFESMLLEIWREVLGITSISKFDDFFQIGGESLSGIRVISNINSMLELDIPVVTIFQKTTIIELAIHIEAKIDELMSLDDDHERFQK